MVTEKQYTLPRPFAEKWIAALRSGEYKQGKGKLGSSKMGYCCLGVAGILCGATDKDYLINSDDLLAYFYSDSDDDFIQIESIKGIIPDNLLGRGIDNPLVKELAWMNDSGSSFPEIADWIEANVEFI